MSVAVNGAGFLGERADAAAGSIVSVFLRVSTLTVLVAAPLAFGATTVVAGIVLAGISWLLLLIWLLEGVRAGALNITSSPVVLPVLLLLAFTAVHWAAGISVLAYSTELEWMRWVGYAALGMVAMQSFDTPRRLKRLAESLAVCGFLIAVLGIAQYLTANGKIYWLIEPSQGGWVFGPYVNKNHYAGLMELWTPLAIGLALRPENTVWRRWFWCLLGIVMGASVVLSGSRGGTLAIAAEAVLLTFVAVAQRGGRRAFLALALALVVTGAGVWFLDQGQIIERYKETMQSRTPDQEEVAANRIGAWQGSLELFRRHWLLGSGLDTFVNLFPGVRPFAADKIWTYAHNDFLQFLAETGVVGAALGIWILVAGAVVGWRNVQGSAGTSHGALLIGLATGCVGLMLHGWLDFNFHVPANAANFSVLAAVLLRRGWDAN